MGVKGFFTENGKTKPVNEKKVRDVSGDDVNVEVNVDVKTDDELEKFAEDKKKEFSNPMIDGSDSKEILIGKDEDGNAIRLELSLERGYFALSGTEFDLNDVFDEEQGEERARERVENDLEEEPYIFNQDFLASHIDLEHLRDQLSEDINSMYMEDAEEDPIEYLKEIYGDEEAMKKAVEFGGIDYEEAIDDAIEQDGWEHFMGDVQPIGNGKYALWGSTGQIDMDNQFKMEKTPLIDDEISIIKKAWKNLHLKNFDKMTDDDRDLMNQTIRIFEKYPEFEDEQIGQYAE